jgi:murein L,D-transpeptidase YafK
LSLSPFVRALLASAALAAAFPLAGCNIDSSYQLPARAMKELSPEMLALLERKAMPKESPILVRVFKEESELELWKQDGSGRFQLLKVYPICRWSGELGPKVKEGDRQAPEGFYTITPGLMNPNSNYYLAINTGFPNAYDKAHGRTGAFLMIHGDCSSRGCYAMTDEQMGEIYSLARESFLGGQKSFQIQAYPFRMTPANFARHRNNPNIPFWKMLKQGNDQFEVTRLEPKVDVCERRYVFNAQAPANATKPLTFNPSGHCPVFEVPEEIASAALEKQRNDEYQIAQLVSRNVAVAPVRTGRDGGMNSVFLAKLSKPSATFDSDGRMRAPPAAPGPLPANASPPSSEPETTATVVADVPLPRAAPQVKQGSSESSWASRLFGGMFSSQEKREATRVASAEPRGGLFGNLFTTNGDTALDRMQKALGLRGPEAPDSTARAAPPPPKPKPVVHTRTATAAAIKPKPKAETQEAETAKPAAVQPAQQASAFQPTTNSSSLLKGAQPVVPTGSFDSRWSGLR